MAFSGDRTSGVILKYVGEASPPGKKLNRALSRPKWRT